MKLADAIAEIERRFPAVDGTPSALCQTGEPYEVIMSGGALDKYSRFPCLCTSEEVAVRLWYEAVLQYAEGRKGMLYWRIRPQLEPRNRYVEDGFIIDKAPLHFLAELYWVVYSRLIITDRPAIEEAA